ncbi:MAG: hypothetical protein ACTS5I_05645 [Rhodanobacter sp.]
MSWIANLAAGRLMPTVALALGATAAILAGLLAIQTRRVEAVRAAKAGAEVALVAAQGAVAEQSKALEQWRAMAAASLDRQLEAEARAVQEAATAAILRSRIGALMKSDEASPDCRALLDTRLDAICPGTAQSIRLWGGQ